MTVEQIVKDVRARGDAAVRDWALQLDGVEPARDVDPHRLERHPAPLQLDARLDLEADVRRPLRLVPAADAVGERADGFDGQVARAGDAFGLDAV